MVAPSILVAKVASVLREKVRRNETTFSEGQEALLVLGLLNIRLVSGFPLLRRAFELATELDLPSVYDTLYLAAAEREHCDLCTADARFARAASARYPFVRLVGSPWRLLGWEARTPPSDDTLSRPALHHFSSSEMIDCGLVHPARKAVLNAQPCDSKGNGQSDADLAG